MKSNTQLIDSFQQQHEQFLKLLLKFPVNKRREILFDAWALHDIIVHLIAWNKVNTLHTESIRDEKPFTWIEDVDAFNAQEVGKRKNDTWEAIYSDLDNSGKELAKLFESLDASIWDKKYVKDHTSTPRTFFICAIEHYESTHIPQVKKRLQELEQ